MIWWICSALLMHAYTHVVTEGKLLGIVRLYQTLLLKKNLKKTFRDSRTIRRVQLTSVKSVVREVHTAWLSKTKTKQTQKDACNTNLVKYIYASHLEEHEKPFSILSASRKWLKGLNVGYLPCNAPTPTPGVYGSSYLPCQEMEPVVGHITWWSVF